LSETTREFYDAFVRGVQAAAFSEPNLRLVAVAGLVDRFVPAGARVLEVGCGIGVTTRHLVERGCRVVALDLSPVAVDVARRFAPDADILVHDACSDPGPMLAKGPFDCIVMADVVEHLPRDARPAALRALVSLLAPRGSIVLAWPTPGYQEHLGAHRPEALQVVDETVELADLLAESGLAPRYFALVDVWEKDQYAHAVLERKREHDATQLPLGLAERVRARVRRALWRRKTRDMRRLLELK
jgi:SAM-dependent methyltransferase